MRNNLKIKLIHGGEQEGTLVESVIFFKTEEEFLQDLKETTADLSDSLNETLELHKINDNNYVITDSIDQTVMHYEIMSWEER